MECLCINFNKNSNILFLFNFQTWNSKIVYIYISLYILRRIKKRRVIYKRRRWVVEDEKNPLEIDYGGLGGSGLAELNRRQSRCRTRIRLQVPVTRSFFIFFWPKVFAHRDRTGDPQGFRHTWTIPRAGRDESQHAT